MQPLPFEGDSVTANNRWLTAIMKLAKSPHSKTVTLVLNVKAYEDDKLMWQELREWDCNCGDIFLKVHLSHQGKKLRIIKKYLHIREGKYMYK